ncbi:MAG: beta-propeller domain-containing protein, partial [Longimicrobiales bacterium]|nr:beta-propeller domain-containing protein [Longimicrobiales bacterium]
MLVTGRVSEVDGDPLAGAQAQVGTAGTLSAESGTFEIRLEEGAVDTGSADLRVQLIGYQSVELPLDAEPGQRIDVTVRMCPLALALESMVIASAEIQPAASVTNVQHAGVDEGGIVKLRDRHLVVLRRGRLHTVDLGDDALVEVDATEAFAEGIDASGDWYDEILLSGSDVVVLGYSYDRAATEIGLFRLADDGTLSHRATHQLRSFDYYSSRNYASRLVDGRLVLYAPMPLYGGEDPRRGLPAIRRWTPDGSETFEPVVSSSRVYQGGYPLDPEQTPVLHTILSCGVEAPELDCRTTAVVGGWSRVSYVSPEAVWLWVDGSGNDGAAMLYRLPLDGAPPGAVQVRGSPVDQFSFLEDADDHLNVVVRSVGYGEGMWGPEWSGGDVALLRLPVAALGDGRDSVPSAAYRPLPEPAPGQAFHNRFVGEHLLYGSGSGWGPPDTTAVSLVHVVGIESGAVASLSVPHGVERIEPMGSDAVVVGSAGEDLHFTGIDLDALPSTVQHFVLEGASQGELRSHGFFYRADGEGDGVLGLPVAGPARPGWRHLVDGSASVVF